MTESARTTYPVKAYERGVLMYGSFKPNGANPLASENMTGGTFARTGVGTVDLTMHHPVQDASMPICQLHMGTPDGSYAMCTGKTVTAGIAVYTFTTFSALHAAADIAADATNIVTVIFPVKIQGP